MRTQDIIISISDNDLMQIGVDPNTVTDEQFEAIVKNMQENISLVLLNYSDVSINFLDELSDAVKEAGIPVA